jgi:hypothetical protein
MRCLDLVFITMTLRVNYKLNHLTRCVKTLAEKILFFFQGRLFAALC